MLASCLASGLHESYAYFLHAHRGHKAFENHYFIVHVAVTQLHQRVALFRPRLSNSQPDAIIAARQPCFNGVKGCAMEVSVFVGQRTSQRVA